MNVIAFKTPLRQLLQGPLSFGSQPPQKNILSDIGQCPDRPVKAEATETPQALLNQLKAPLLAVIRADGSQLEINGLAVMQILDTLFQQNIQASQNSSTPHTGVFYNQLTGVFSNKSMVRIIPEKEKEAMKELNWLIGGPKALNGWVPVKSGHDLRITLNRSLEALQKLGYVSMKAWLPSEPVAGGIVTDFANQADHLYIILTAKGQAWLKTLA